MTFLKFNARGKKRKKGSGAEVVIEDNARPVAVVRLAEPYVRLLSESLRLAREHGSTATLDAGKKGGKARMASLTPEQRKELAKKAIQTRWAKAKKKPRPSAK